MKKVTQESKWNPGMRSDSEPQPYQDPDFGPGMEYESGDRRPPSEQVKQVRKKWRKEVQARQGARKPTKKRAIKGTR